jgi:hypothetical protein
MGYKLCHTILKREETPWSNLSENPPGGLPPSPTLTSACHQQPSNLPDCWGQTMWYLRNVYITVSSWGGWSDVSRLYAVIPFCPLRHGDLRVLNAPCMKHNLLWVLQNTLPMGFVFLLFHIVPIWFDSSLSGHFLCDFWNSCHRKAHPTPKGCNYQLEGFFFT